jgi:hypothetical protein
VRHRPLPPDRLPVIERQTDLGAPPPPFVPLD